MRFLPNQDELATLAGQGNTVPVYCQLLSDNLTPVTAFARVSAQSDHAFLLESVVGGEKIGRYSFIAARPFKTFEATRDRVVIEYPSQGTREESRAEDPLAVLEAHVARHRAVHLPELPRFCGGAVGYAGYDMVRYDEHLPNAPEDDRGLPDLLFGLYDTMVLFDHVNKTIKVVGLAHIGRHGVEKAYEGACRRIQETVEALSQPRMSQVGTIATEDQPTLPFTSNFRREDFERGVEACKEYIRAGDIFQVVLSQRLCVETDADPFNVYRALRVVNPSPFMFYLKNPSCTLVGSSPEIMCRVEDGIVTNRPLAGTRRRGRTEAEDKGLEQELLADPKERAEHIMLVDLGRNDVGRVAKLGSVKLTDVMAIERYSHVMHISSEVQGTLGEGKTAFDALRAALPVGTVSGAPKVRAMEIIDEFEPTRRGPYAGAVGYMDFAGNMDTCIALRTMVVMDNRRFVDTPAKRYRVYMQAGCGIVADSVPASEYEETISKARALLKAVEAAETGFQ
ncbi:MAG: anthranilate synthase component I [Phycisphaerae bacterium]|nr:anthranilate synthase component I [Phycisphaerae bacterium]